MAKQFTVTPSELRRKADELRQLNGNFDRYINDLLNQERQLYGMWEGDAHESFHNALMNDEQKMRSFKRAVDDFSAKLMQIAGEYERTESINNNIATTRTAH